MKSFQPKDDDPGGPPPPAHDQSFADTDQQTQQTETHASLTDPDPRLYKKAPGAAAMLCLIGHTLMEHRNGPVVHAELNHADGHDGLQSAQTTEAPGLTGWTNGAPGPDDRGESSSDRGGRDNVLPARLFQQPVLMIAVNPLFYGK